MLDDARIGQVEAAEDGVAVHAAALRNQSSKVLRTCISVSVPSYKVLTSHETTPSGLRRCTRLELLTCADGSRSGDHSSSNSQKNT